MEKMNDVDRASQAGSGQDDPTVVYRERNTTNSHAKSDECPPQPSHGISSLFNVAKEVLEQNRKFKKDKEEVHRRLYDKLIQTRVLQKRGTFTNNYSIYEVMIDN